MGDLNTVGNQCKLVMFLSQYNTYWVTVDGERYLCLDYVTAPVFFKLGRFNYLEKEIVTIHYLPDNFKLEINGNVATIHKSDGSVISIEGIYDKEHIKNDKPFDGNYNLLREEFVDYEHSFDEGDYRYYVIDLFKIGTLNRKNKNTGMVINEWFRNDFKSFDGTGKTLTYCYICNLKTMKVKDMVKWDIVNECEVR